MTASPATKPASGVEATNKGPRAGHSTSAPTVESEVHGPWNPGIQSQLPRALLPLCTVFRPENVSTTFEQAVELRDFTGLELHQLVSFRAERLVVHELLVRVTADFSVPDGQHYEDLGINFRRVTRTMLDNYIEPHMPELKAAFAELRTRMAGAVAAALDGRNVDASARQERASKPQAGSWFARMLGRPAEHARAPRLPGRSPIDGWRETAVSGSDPIEAAACRALVRVAEAVSARHGRLWGDGALLGDIAIDLACNEYGSAALGELLEPYIARAAQREGFERLPVQSRPVVMNTKGASAAGKSTLRPLQRRLAAKIGVRWEDFALISPDIWRKFLLDYESLGEYYKYAGTFSGHELAIVDRKLDRYMAQKARSGRMSHLVIDRFRFDSFAASTDDEGGNLLTRFGHLVYLFFMVTPPEATVERAWKRGLEVGRYKAVDDLLAHNVEAYTGMPQLFLHFALRTDRTVHYEFLDNGVPQGARPRTIAFGCNGEMNVLDIAGLVNIARFRAINVDAKDPAAVYVRAGSKAPETNFEFLEQCARSLSALNFADADTGKVYARIEDGRLTWADTEALAMARRDPATRAALDAIAPGAHPVGGTAGTEPGFVANLEIEAARHTLGQRGESGNADVGAAP